MVLEFFSVVTTAIPFVASEGTESVFAGELELETATAGALVIVVLGTVLLGVLIATAFVATDSALLLFVTTMFVAATSVEVFVLVVESAR